MFTHAGLRDLWRTLGAVAACVAAAAVLPARAERPPSAAAVPVARAVTGACHLADGSCREMSAPACTRAGGVYAGNDTACDPDAGRDDYSLELVADVPPTGGVTVDLIDAIRVRRAAPDEIVFASKNVGADCGFGTPASAWKVIVDPVTGRGTPVLKQHLSEVQSVRGRIFEASDGTLFTGGGWCGHKPPYVSLDGGETWRATTRGEHPPNSTFSIIEFSGAVYAGTGYDPYPAELYRWLGGTGPSDWERVITFPGPRGLVASMVTLHGQMFACLDIIPCPTMGGAPVYVTSNGNDYTGTLGPPTYVSGSDLVTVGDTMILISRRDNRTCTDGSLYIWNEDLATWQWEAPYVLGTRTAPPVADSDAMYYCGTKAGEDPGGIYESRDLGWTWQRIVQIPAETVYAMDVHEGVLYVGAGRDSNDVAHIYRVSLGHPKLTLEPDRTCYHVGDEVTVEVWMRNVREPIVGGQFAVQYDPRLVLGSPAHAGGDAIVPGDAPLTRQLYECSTQEQTNPHCLPQARQASYAVGVGEPNETTQGDQRLAVLHFTATGEVCGAAQVVRFSPEAPLETRLTTASGVPYPLAELVDLPVITVDSTPPVVIAPPDIAVNAPAGACEAAVDAGTALAVDNCGGVLTPAGTRSDARPLDAPYPAGTTTITWAVSDACDNIGTDAQLVTIQVYNRAVVTLELQGPLQNAVVRCVTINFHDCAHGGAGSGHEVDVTFPANPSGNSVATAVLSGVPCGPNVFDCVSVEDELHTLRAKVTPTLADGAYVIDLTGPTNMLYQADLYNDGVVDIVDYAVFLAEWGWFGDPATPCSVTAPHADMDASGVVDAQDYVFIAGNFGLEDDLACCVCGLSREPRRSIGVRELRMLGLGHLAAADLTQDGVVDAADVEAFERGVRPAVSDVREGVRRGGSAE